MAGLDTLLSRSDSLLRELRASRSSSSSSARGAIPYSSHGLSVALASGRVALTGSLSRGSLAEHSFRGSEKPTSVLVTPPSNVLVPPTAVATVVEERASLYSLAGHYDDAPSQDAGGGGGGGSLLERLRTAYAAEARIVPANGSRAIHGWEDGSNAPDGSAQGAAISVSGDASVDTFLPSDKLPRVIAAAATHVRGSGATRNLEERVRTWASSRDEAFAKRHVRLYLVPGGAPSRAPPLRWGDVVDAYITCATTVAAADSNENIISNNALNQGIVASGFATPVSSAASSVTGGDDNENDNDYAGSAATASLHLPQPLAIVRPDGSGLGVTAFHVTAKLGGKPIVAGRDIVVVSGGRVFRKSALSSEEYTALSQEPSQVAVNIVSQEGANATTTTATRLLSRPPRPHPQHQHQTKFIDTPSTAVTRVEDTRRTFAHTAEEELTRAALPLDVTTASSTSSSANTSFVVANDHELLQTQMPLRPTVSSSTSSVIKTSGGSTPVTPSRTIIAATFTQAPIPTSSFSIPSPPPLAMIDCVPLLESTAKLHADTLAVLHPAQTLRLWHCFIDAAGGLAPLAAANTTSSSSNAAIAIPRQHPVLTNGPSKYAFLKEPTLTKSLTSTRVLLPELLAFCARLGYNPLLLPRVRSDAATLISERGNLRGVTFADACDFVAGVFLRGDDAHNGASSLSTRAVAIASAQCELAIKSAETAAAADVLRASVGLTPRRSVTAWGGVNIDTLAAGAAAVKTTGIFSDGGAAVTSLYMAVPIIGRDGVMVSIPPIPLDKTAITGIRDGRACPVLMHMIDGWLGPPGTDPWYQAESMNYELYATKVLRTAPSIEAVMPVPHIDTETVIQLPPPPTAPEPIVATVSGLVTERERSASSVVEAISLATETLPLSPPQPSHPFSLGTTIFARFKGGDTAYRGTVAGVRLVRLRDKSSSSTAAICYYSIAYEDGDEEDNVAAHFVRYRGPTDTSLPPLPALTPSSLASASASSIPTVLSSALALASASKPTILLPSPIVSTAVIIDSSIPLPPSVARQSSLVSTPQVAMLQVVTPQVEKLLEKLSTSPEVENNDVPITASSLSSSLSTTTTTTTMTVAAVAEPVAELTLSFPPQNINVEVAPLVLTMPISTINPVPTSVLLSSTNEIESKEDDNNNNDTITTSTTQTLTQGANIQPPNIEAPVTPFVAPSAIDPNNTAEVEQASISSSNTDNTNQFDMGDGDPIVVNHTNSTVKISKSRQPTTPTRSVSGGGGGVGGLSWSKNLVSPGGGSNPRHRVSSPRATSLKR